MAIRMATKEDRQEQIVYHLKQAAEIFYAFELDGKLYDNPAAVTQAREGLEHIRTLVFELTGQYLQEKTPEERMQEINSHYGGNNTLF